MYRGVPLKMVVTMAACWASMGLVLSSLVDHKMPIRTAAEDEITNLPGLNEHLGFKQYSGYLHGDKDPKTNVTFIHYWFVESQTNTAADPLVVWLGSGLVGCSNIMALLTEIGPFLVGEGPVLKENAHSWNKHANLLFLDTPAGVGFSYRLDTGNYSNDDVILTQNYFALKSFVAKFPQFHKRPIYLIGRHYAGTQLPLLALKLDEDAELNFRGFAIGNGYIETLRNTAAMLFNGYYNGILSEKVWKSFIEACCRQGLPPSRDNCYFSQSGLCGPAISEAKRVIIQSGLNIYNMDQPCTGDNMPKTISSRPLKVSQSESSSLLENKEPQSATKSGSPVDPECNSRETLYGYMNRQDVRHAIHVPAELAANTYKPCNSWLRQFYREIYLLEDYGLMPQIGELLKSPSKPHLLFYNGDADLICPQLGARWIVDELGAKLLQDHQPWYVDGQVAGFRRQFEGVSFMTLRGAGQMVAIDKPVEALELFEKYLLGL